MNRLGQRRIDERGSHDRQELGSFFFGDVTGGHLGFDDADKPREGESLDDEGSRSDEQGDREQEGAHRRVRRDGLRRSQGDRAAHACPDDDAAFARPQGLVREIIQVRPALGVATFPALEAAAVVVEGSFPVLGAQVAGLEHLGVHLAGGVHAFFEALDACRLGLVTALAVSASVVQPGEHDGDEESAHAHDERAEGNGEECGERQASRELAGLFDDAKGLQSHRQEDRALQDEGHGLPVLLGETPVVRGNRGGPASGDNQASDDGGDEARAAEVFGRDRSDEGHCERENGVGGGFFKECSQAHAHLANDPSDGGRDAQGDGDLADEHARVERVLVGRQARAHRGGEQHEGGRIVEEALPLEHGDDAVGDTGAFRDRNGDSVRG